MQQSAVISFFIERSLAFNPSQTAQSYTIRPRYIYPMSALRKIVVIGPESTGKSTLSAALASALETSWNPEYARFYYMQPSQVTLFQPD